MEKYVYKLRVSTLWENSQQQKVGFSSCLYQNIDYFVGLMIFIAHCAKKLYNFIALYDSSQHTACYIVGLQLISPI